METEPREKNPAAVALGRLGGKARLIKITAKRRREIARKAAAARWGKTDPPPTGTDPGGKVVSIAAAGRKGGKARAAKMTPAQRSAAARKAVNARWARVRGDIVVSMYVRSEWIRGGANDGTSYPGLHVRLEGDLPA